MTKKELELKREYIEIMSQKKEKDHLLYLLKNPSKKKHKRQKGLSFLDEMKVKELQTS